MGIMCLPIGIVLSFRYPITILVIVKYSLFLALFSVHLRYSSNSDFFNLIVFCLLASDCKGGDDCCSPKSRCKDGHGDCDTGLDCISGLCGDNNCNTGEFPSFEGDDDCCVPTNGNCYLFYQGSGRTPVGISGRELVATLKRLHY